MQFTSRLVEYFDSKHGNFKEAQFSNVHLYGYILYDVLCRLK